VQIDVHRRLERRFDDPRNVENTNSAGRVAGQNRPLAFLRVGGQRQRESAGAIGLDHR
jgi:hypothetical protein